MTTNTTTTNATNQPATINDVELYDALKGSSRMDDRLFHDLVHRTAEALADFRRANKAVEGHRDSIVRECASLNCRRNSDCVGAAWITNAADDLAKALERRNAAHRQASEGLRVLHEIGALPERRIPDYTAPATL